MASLTDVANGNGANASDVQQIIDLLKGTAGKGIAVGLTAVNDAVNFALAVKNNDAGGSKCAIFYKSDGTVLFQIDKNGITASAIVSPVLNGAVTGTAGFNAFTGWTPIITQSNTPTLTNNSSTYSQIGKWVSVNANLLLTSAGTLANTITVSGLPVNFKYSGTNAVVGKFFVAHAGQNYVGSVVTNTLNSVAFLAGQGTGGFLGSTNGPSFALANGDVISFDLLYEAA